MNEAERRKVRVYAEQKARAVSCDVVVKAYNHILTVPDQGEMTERTIRGGRNARPSRVSGVPAKAAGALLSAAVLGSTFPRAAGSAYWLASLPVVPLLSYVSWLGAIRIAWDVSNTVSDEAVETVKAIGAEARSVAEAASLEARSWVVTFGGPIRGAIYLSALFLGTFALWLLVATLCGSSGLRGLRRTRTR